MNELEQRLTSVEDRLAISEIVSRYSYYVDHKMLEEFLDLFADDAITDYGVLGRMEGKDQIGTFFAEYLSGRTNCKFWFHMIHNGFVETNGNAAKGSWQIEVAYTYQDLGAVWVFGVYENEFVRLSGKWKIKAVNFRPCVLTPYREGWDRVGFVIPGYPKV